MLLASSLLLTSHLDVKIASQGYVKSATSLFVIAEEQK